ncbi:MOSC domain-containing protein [Xinfangfangia sp. CPCC 101601]|uniref:MOSC domain-containing protein n=1 Tax=Pseudogemmobacter lacusdianii TaxID=3069608 RepID=A0ABU0W126_9RHOB|nr:MOSC domain-containing protein [Xinfangfangia sp. CPCC 101601]MDQ2067682.1 MOSC domain-containing protein [Xinfangfangia sp. CPCC 101601]
MDIVQETYLRKKLRCSMPSILSVSRSRLHDFSKANEDHLVLVENYGVEGDAHAGETVKHRSRVAVDPSQPNLRQVHLLHHELLASLADKGFDLKAGDLGENILTSGIDLLGLPTDTVLAIGADVKLRVTGLRNPCAQIESFRTGLLQEVVTRGADGNLVRKAGIMSVVVAGGIVKPGDEIRAILPDLPHLPLERV